MTAEATQLHASNRYSVTVGELEWTDAHGFRALLLFTMETEYSDAWVGPDHTIDPLLAEVWPCIARPMGHSAYAMESLTGDALAAWLKTHHDELVELALDVNQAKREAHDEALAELR